MSALIDGLIAAERIPIRGLEQRKTATSQRISTLGEIISKLKALEAKAKELDAPSELAAYQVTSSNEARVTARVSSDVTPGSHTVRVNALAAAQINRSKSYATINPPGNGTLEIRVGSDPKVTINFNNSMTLEDIAAAIDGSAARVGASVIHDGSGYRIVVTGDDAGTANAVTFTEKSGTKLGFDSSSLVQAASNASIVFDGLAITRTSNTIDNLIPGVVLELHSVRPAGEADAIISVSRDPKAVREKLQGFVDAYNEVAKLVARELGKSGETVSKGQMLGDSTLRSLQRKLGGIAGAAFAHGGTNIALGSVGIGLASDGTLSIDASKFDAKYDADPDAIADLFAGGGQSFTARVSSLVTEYTRAGTGVLVAKQSGLESRVDDYEAQIGRIESRATELGERLRKTFAALDQKVSALQTQQQQLSAVLFGVGPY
jgi:flagellar hook-associated protein 2